jgi:hypothetical protein
MNSAQPSRAALLLSRSSEWLVLAYLLATCVQPNLFRHDAVTPVAKLDLLDGSWLLDTSFKASGGIWFGRDVAFTYGPLFQWLSSAPARWFGVSMGMIYATWYTLPFVVIVLSTFATVRLLLPDAAAWRRALLVLLAAVFWSPPDVRTSVAVVAFAALMRLTGAAINQGRRLALLACACAAICVAGFWLSADTGLYTTVGLGLCVVATAISTREIRRATRFTAIAALSFGALVLLTNALLRSVFDFGFWRATFAIAGSYRWLEPFGMNKVDKHRLLEALALLLVVFAAAWFFRKNNGPWTRRPAFLLAGFGFAFLLMQSALVRSDYGHVLIGMFPALFLCGMIAMDSFPSPALSAALPLITLAATLGFASSHPLFRPADVLSRWRQVAHPQLACAPPSVKFDQACFPAADAKLLTDIASYIDAHTQAADRIAVFPYETAFGIASWRQVGGGVLQSYLVGGDYLTRVEIEGLERDRPPLALYFPDRPISFTVDDVPNFTRSPEVWFYFLKHYRAAGTPVPGAVALVRDIGREAQIGFRAEPLAGSLPAQAVKKRTTWIPLPMAQWPTGGADFVRMRVKVNYPFGWRLRKPAKLTLHFSFADGSGNAIKFLVEPNRATDVWIYPWNDSRMDSYFGDDPSTWGCDDHPAVVGLKLLVNPFDWVSVLPNSITVESIEAIALTQR